MFVEHDGIMYENRDLSTKNSSATGRLAFTYYDIFKKLFETVGKFF